MELECKICSENLANQAYKCFRITYWNENKILETFYFCKKCFKNKTTGKKNKELYIKSSIVKGATRYKCRKWEISKKRKRRIILYSIIIFVLLLLIISTSTALYYINRYNSINESCTCHN